MEKQEITGKIIKVGNSAGILLPREWLNGEAKVTLVQKPLNPEKEIFEILNEEMPSIISLALVGSYARKEENQKSDVDILGITTSLNKKIPPIFRFLIGLILLNVPPIIYLTIVGPKIAPIYVAVVFLIINIAALIAYFKIKEVEVESPVGKFKARK